MISKKTPPPGPVRSSPAPSDDIFWADNLASQLLQRNKKHNIIVKAGASPSGAKHIGNLFDVMKAYIVYKALKHKAQSSSSSDRLSEAQSNSNVDRFPEGKSSSSSDRFPEGARFILTHDDRDPMRKVPMRIPDIDGKWIDTAGGIEQEMRKHIGEPYCNAPDPFGCHHNWAEHFSTVWENGIIASGISESEIKFVSNNGLYIEGKFDPYIRTVLANIDKCREVISKFQETTPRDYIPVLAICENCGKIIGKATDFEVNQRVVTYSCEGRELAGKYKIEGCGYKGDQTWDQCKLTWRFEWPAQWALLNVDFEAFGKDHAEGSWPSGKEIAERIYGITPPLYHIYEFILVDGKKMAARRGNAFLAQDMLGIIEPEVFMYFYTKRSGKQRDLDIKKIYMLVAEFEKAERVYFGIEKESSEQRLATLKREYESAMPVIPKKMPLRIDYQFAAVVSQLAPNIHAAINMLRNSGHVTGHLNPEDEQRVALRLSLAKNWVDRFAPEQRVEIRVRKEAVAKLSDNQKAALKELAQILKKPLKHDDLYQKFYETAKNNNLQPQEFFRACYLALISKESGPRLAPFILALGQERVREMLENI